MSSKPSVHVGIIGHSQHGKTTLTSALTAVSVAIYGTDSTAETRDIAAVEWLATSGIRGCVAEYESLSRRYVHLDFAGAIDLTNVLVREPRTINGLIFLVDATTGIDPAASKMLSLARAGGIPRMVAYVNKVDVSDAVLVEATLLEVAELFARYGYDHAPALRGSALQAFEAARAGTLRHPEVKGIRRLVQAMDDHFSPAANPPMDNQGPISVARTTDAGTAAA